MNTLKINLNPKNLEIITEIFKSEWKPSLQNLGLVITLTSEEFSYPLAFAVLNRDGNNIIVLAKVIKDGFKNQGIEEFLNSYIENYVEINDCILV